MSNKDSLNQSTIKIYIGFFIASIYLLITMIKMKFGNEKNVALFRDVKEKTKKLTTFNRLIVLNFQFFFAIEFFFLFSQNLKTLTFLVNDISEC